MIGLIPVYFDGDEALWREGQDGPLLARVFDSARRSKGLGKVVVASDTAWVLDLAKNYGFETIDPDEAAIAESKLLPLGTNRAMLALGQHRKVDEKVLVVGFRSIFIGDGFLDRVIDEAMTLDSGVGMSVFKSVDHPCQLMGYNRFIDTVLIHFFDKSDQARAIAASLFGPKAGNGWEVTKPIYINWGLKGVVEDDPGAFFRRSYNGGGVEYVRLASASDATGCESIWFMDSAHSARILTPVAGECKKAPREGLDFVGRTITDKKCEDGFALYRDSDNSYSLLPERGSAFQGKIVLKIMPLGPEGARVDGLCELSVDRFEECVTLPLSDDDLCGIIVSVIGAVEDGLYDMSDVFRPSESLWLVNNSHDEACLPDGTRIAGRQAFPNVYEADGACFIMAPEDAGQFDELVEMGMVGGLLREESEAIRIDTEFDLLRLKAAMKAARQSEAGK